MEKPVIVAAYRTAIGSFGGALKNMPAQQLAKAVIEKLLMDTGIDKNNIDEVIMGCVLQSGSGQNMARQAAVNAGISIHTPAMSINQVCGSGLRSVSLAAQTIKAGDSSIVIAGGMENMSRSPYLLDAVRWGCKLGNVETKDTILTDALTDSFLNVHMGITAENIAEEYGISREEQDEFAAFSQQKAENAMNKNKFNDEIVPISIPQKKGEFVIFEKDEFPRFGTTAETLSKLKPAFKKDGTVTAGNASGINDGAAALVVMSENRAHQLGLKPLAEIVSYASVGVEPRIMGMGPVDSSKSALKKAGMGIKDIGLFEVNEAFAAQSIAVIRELNLDYSRVNVNGGAIALGHPLGASGTRILITLLYEMKKRNEELGLATLCVGGGMGVTVIVKNLY